MEPISSVLSFISRVLADRLAVMHEARKRLPWASTRKLAGRLEEVVDKTADKKGERERVIAYLCAQRPDLSMTTIERFIRGADEPSIQQARAICELVGASFNYLWYGDRQPFSADDQMWLSVDSYPSLFLEEEVTSVLLVRGDSLPHTSYAVVGYDKYRYRVLPTLWHVSSINGSGGANSLVELAHLSGELRKVAGVKQVTGIEVRSAICEAVFYGKLHPRALLRKGWKRSYWWDDIADVEHIRPCAREYRQRYDREFFAAQEIIKWVRRS